MKTVVFYHAKCSLHALFITGDTFRQYDNITKSSARRLTFMVFQALRNDIMTVAPNPTGDIAWIATEKKHRSTDDFTAQSQNILDHQDDYSHTVPSGTTSALERPNGTIDLIIIPWLESGTSSIPYVPGLVVKVSKYVTSIYPSMEDLVKLGVARFDAENNRYVINRNLTLACFERNRERKE